MDISLCLENSGILSLRVCGNPVLCFHSKTHWHMQSLVYNYFPAHTWIVWEAKWPIQDRQSVIEAGASTAALSYKNVPQWLMLVKECFVIVFLLCLSVHLSSTKVSSLSYSNSKLICCEKCNGTSDQKNKTKPTFIRHHLFFSQTSLVYVFCNVIEWMS